MRKTLFFFLIKWHKIQGKSIESLWHMNSNISYTFHLKKFKIWYNHIKDIGVQKQEAEIRAVMSKMLWAGKFCLPQQLGLKGLNYMSQIMSFSGLHDVQKVLIDLKKKLQLYCPTRISPMENLGCFCLRKPAVTLEPCYPTYHACWVF